MDRISELPEFVVHHILSFFDCWDWDDEHGRHDRASHLVRMSVLSKKWFHLTASFPILDFTIYRFKHDEESFYKYVEYTTSRFCHQNVPAHKLTFYTTLREPAELDVVNQCLELLLNQGVRELDIDITNLLESPPPSASSNYHLPNALLSVSLLKSLTLTGCHLPSSLMLDVVKFKSLTHLKLEGVPIDDQVIRYLTTSCPLLQDFHIQSCHGFKRFCVYGHQSLEKVCIYCDTQVERIDIEAPNLSHLTVTDEDGRGPPQINVASCKKLTTVTYNGTYNRHPLPNSKGFNDFLSNFPFVKDLNLLIEYKCNNVKLSSHSLRTLVLHSNCDLDEIEFSTPNLRLFIYSCSLRYLWTMEKPLPHLKACMRCYLGVSIDARWFQKLRLFFDKKNGFKASTLYINTDRKYIVLEKLKAQLPPYELEHVELHLELPNYEEPSDHAALVDALLWCFRPRSLTLRSSFPLTDFEEVVKFTYEKLLQQEDGGHTNIMIVPPSSSIAQMHFKGLMPFPGAFPPEGKAISFIKEKLSKKEQDNEPVNVMHWI